MHVIGTAGHVDHGKSALVHRLTGIDPDRFEEEKRRGLTIDLGFAWMTLPSGEEIGIVDVPGHERFIKNMLAGAGGISVCLFVVAANEGWMPQSSEHLGVLDMLDVSSGVVALTKSDLVDDETLGLRAIEIAEHLEPTSLSGAPVVPCSAATEAGLGDLVKVLDAVVSAVPGAPDLGRPRLWIDRVFTIAGAGTVVTGTLAEGGLASGDGVEIAPEGRPARVRSIQTHKREVTSIAPGNRAAVNLAGLEREGARRGDALVAPRTWRATARLDAIVRVLPAELTSGEHRLRARGAHLLYVGTAETPVRIQLLDKTAIASGESGFARLHLRDPLPLRRGDRFVLRDAGRVLTLGGGSVLDPLPGTRRAGSPDHLELLDRLRVASPSDALAALVAAHSELDRAEALFRAEAGEVPGGVVTLGNLLVSPARMEELGGLLTEELSRHHSSHPLERGLPRTSARTLTGLGPDPFSALIARLDDVSDDGAFVSRAGFSVELDPTERKARDELMATIEAGGFAPPVAKDLGANGALVRALVAAGELVRVGDFYLTRSQAQRARSAVRERIGASGGLSVAEIRDLLATTRKYAVPLCEWLDASGATRRHGDLRVLGPTP